MVYWAFGGWNSYLRFKWLNTFCMIPLAAEQSHVSFGHIPITPSLKPPNLPHQL
jgi:hypothetical protein